MKTSTNLNSNTLTPRKLCLLILKEWGASKSFIHEHSLLANATPQERAWIRNTNSGILKNLTLLDHWISLYSKKMPKSNVLWLLRLGVFQLSPISDSAEHAAIHTTVDLAKELHGNQVAKFCNSILRKIQSSEFPTPLGNRAIDLSKRYSHPVWLIKKWIKAKGTHLTLARLEENQKDAPRWLRVNLQKSSLSQILKSTDLEFGETLFERYIELKSPWRDFINHPLLKTGVLSPQDPAAWLMTRLLELKENESLLDLCGAPGGKTALLLEEFPNNLIVCSDLKNHRIQKALELKSRLNIDAQLVCQDALNPCHSEYSFDKILADVPCSNLGVLARRTEARWTISEKEIQSLAKLQLSILESASKLLKVGGIIVYGTCSPEFDETEHVIQQFLEKHPEFTLGNSSLLPAEYHSKPGLLELWPGQGHRMDGFFGAQLIKIKKHDE